MTHFDPFALNEPGAVLIDDLDLDAGAGKTYLFIKPLEVLVANSSDEVQNCLEAMDARLEAGFYLAGYLGYEAGLVLDKVIHTRHEVSRQLPRATGKMPVVQPHVPRASCPWPPLVWMGVYRDFQIFDYNSIDLGEQDQPGDVRNLRLNIEEDEYRNSIRRIREYISAGDVYQVNYTCKLLFEHDKSSLRLFARLRNAHPVGFSAFINLGDTQILSISPELFLRRTGDQIVTRPMKGTARRGRWFEEDAQVARRLAADEKNRAENVMILDLMRNDLGRVCRSGHVRVPRMYHVEQYGTVFQMISEVEGHLDRDVSASRLLRAVFPPGSVTGAPKIRALEIIDELEREARGVYCGSVGMFRPGGDCLLNVAIRTITQRGAHCEMGVGSGIVADSDPDEELNETLLKGSFVLSSPIEFQLLETLLYRPGEFFLWFEEHLKRVLNSAAYFGWRISEDLLRDALAHSAQDVENSGRDLVGGGARVRLLVSRDASVKTEWSDAGASPSKPVRLLLSNRRTDPSNVFLYHKTTNREAYDHDFHQARATGYFDVIYLNTRDELTEGAITNLLLKLDGHWYTPPLESGLLPGIWRAGLLLEGGVLEKKLLIEDLYRAEAVAVGNSVRGSVEADLVEDAEENVLWSL